jgi:Ser/Thr protein kinase RdoA (MazF antagonist)
MGSILRQAREVLLGRDWWSLPHIPVHGEFCQYHCRYEGEEVIAVIDWDTTRLAPRIQDLARAIDVGMGWSSAVSTYDSFQWRLTDTATIEDVAKWLSCYLELAPPLSRTEAELLPYACAAMWPTAGGSQVPGTDEQVQDCERVVQFMRFWVDEAQAISDVLM